MSEIEHSQRHEPLLEFKDDVDSFTPTTYGTVCELQACVHDVLILAPY